MLNIQLNRHLKIGNIFTVFWINLIDNTILRERAIVVSVVKKGSDREITNEHLNELEFLAETAGAEIIERFVQELAKPSVVTMIGSGKAEEIKEFVKENSINLAIFDEDLSPVQLRNLEKIFEIKVIDRSGIILDIFANHARTNEAKTQVELAQLQYMMPRLTRMWTHLSKQFGGIGTKGPGETQIETDRRMVKQRIQMLKDKLDDISRNKEIQRRNRSKFPRFALVGYTNAGKSTLMNVLTQAEVYVEDKLFATLDTTVRQFLLPAGMEALISDTVGFIRKLPTHLVASFRSTLAEAAEADVIIHVVDVSHPYFRDQIKVVEATLDSLKIFEKPTMLVLNKVDLMDEYIGLNSIKNEYENSIFISAKKNMNITALLDKMQDVYNEHSKEVEFRLPYDRMEMIALLYKCAEITERIDTDEGITFKVRVKPEDAEYFNNKFGLFINK
ncbi:MAG: GTPase HflX [Candidatus Kapabacteria bacterium]|nr:GTPase HflX [Ignavibacteriota bacterium]MCW5884735.1 GTPase HflX [Candidatus Kapabacteria bacterium]